MNQAPTVIPENPEAAYLYGLGIAIQNLTPRVTESYWFNGENQFNQRMQMIDSLHSKAMEVLKNKEK